MNDDEERARALWRVKAFTTLCARPASIGLRSVADGPNAALAVEMLKEALARKPAATDSARIQATTDLRHNGATHDSTSIPIDAEPR